MRQQVQGSDEPNLEIKERNKPKNYRKKNEVGKKSNIIKIEEKINNNLRA